MASEQATGKLVSEPGIREPAAGRRVRPEAPFKYGRAIPTVVALLLVVGFPLIFALYVSVHDYDPTEGRIGAFVGLQNFARTVGDDLFATAARNTAVLALAVVAIELVVALGLALLPQEWLGG